MNEEESFRDKIATVDQDGNRVWIYPKKPKGDYTKYRNYVSYVLLIIFFSAPFIKIKGEPLILINVLERHFVFFGVVFWPQDFHIFLIGMITFVVFIVLFTVIFGRLFCGWACPQTIFMEMVFRKIEYFIEGDWRDQQALDRADWTWKKIFKKSTKHIVFFSLSMLISNWFLMYIIGFEQWWIIVTGDPNEHLLGLGVMVVFAITFYGVYAQFREQVCTTVCPYGRLQGVMLDKNSVVVAYDYKRGESRSKWAKEDNRKNEESGHCIDCHHCVDVCPTGIDIRDGIQMECVSCTACIDACDDIMQKVDLPTGLIRYASEENIANNEKFRWTKRIIGYSVVLVGLLALLAVLLITRSDVETSVLRTPGILYQKLEGHKISNLYNIKIVNKTRNEIPLKLKLENYKGEIKMVGKIPEVKPQAISEGALFVILDEGDIKAIKTKLEIGVYDGERLIEIVTTTFVAPTTY